MHSDHCCHVSRHLHSKIQIFSCYSICVYSLGMLPSHVLPLETMNNRKHFSLSDTGVDPGRGPNAPTPHIRWYPNMKFSPQNCATRAKCSLFSKFLKSWNLPHPDRRGRVGGGGVGLLPKSRNNPLKPRIFVSRGSVCLLCQIILNKIRISMVQTL